MTDPYTSLGRTLAAAAERQEAHRSGQDSGVRAWLSHRLNTAVVAAALLLAGGAVAVAATGVLTGSPVKPEVPSSPVLGNGLPVPDGPGLPVLRAADPDGGLPWGMRILSTTRGQVCVQVGRVQNGRLGELGLDGVFGDDGRFHVLAPDVLPPGYGGGSSTAECMTRGETLIYEDPTADRSAARLLPEEFGGHPQLPPLHDLRLLSFGLLGPHAVSVTYRTPAGLRTVPVSHPYGAFLIIMRAVRPARPFAGGATGGSTSGEANATSVDVGLPSWRTSAVVSAVTFRFGSHLCSQGSGSPLHTRCPMHLAIPPKSWSVPKRSLRALVHLTLLAQSHVACSAAFLTDPCYKGAIEFTAPYAVTTAATDYLVEARAKCKVGGRPETSWGLERDVKLHETVKAVSLGLFKFTPACASKEVFKVTYQNPRGPSAHSPHESVIVGTVAMSKATYPNGTTVTGQHSTRSSG
jgi:hypothetical protein